MKKIFMATTALTLMCGFASAQTNQGAGSSNSGPANAARGGTSGAKMAPNKGVMADPMSKDGMKKDEMSKDSTSIDRAKGGTSGAKMGPLKSGMSDSTSK